MSLKSEVRVTGTQAGFLQGQTSAVCLTQLLRPWLTGLEILELVDPLGQIIRHLGIFTRAWMDASEPKYRSIPGRPPG